MATKSILKNITLKDDLSARCFANALERAKKNYEKKAYVDPSVSTISRKEIRELFGEKSV